MSQAVAQTANRPAGKSCIAVEATWRRGRARVARRDRVTHRPARVGTLGSVAPWVLWLIAAGLFAAGEVVSVDLVLLMFAGGALGGAGVALLGGPSALQLLAFVAGVAGACSPSSARSRSGT